MESIEAFDLNGYLQRIGYRDTPSATIESFFQLHRLHATTITFENLDILLGRPIHIDLASIQQKLVRDRRGGYCFEQNTLFAAALNALGFTTTMLAARVKYRAHHVLPRTHVLLLVSAEDTLWIADVGFGTVGLLEPIPLRAEDEFQQCGWSYRLLEEAGTWTLQTRIEQKWESLYAFTLEPQYPVDLEMANWYVSTSPQSKFVQMLIVQRSTEDVRYLLRNLFFTEDRSGTQTTVELPDQEALLRLLAEKFDLTFPEGTRFKIPSLEAAG